jgi:hypothetical protein
MKVRHFLATMIAPVALAACGPMSTGTVKDLNVQDWDGHSATHLIQSWGKPHHDYPMADGGRAIGYLFTNQAVTGPKSQVIFQARNCMVNFTVDRNGIIDDATTTGSKCTIGSHGGMHPRPTRLDRSAELRLRYEIAKEFAPCVGVSFQRFAGKTAGFVAASGEQTSLVRALVGLKFWRMS